MKYIKVLSVEVPDIKELNIIKNSEISTEEKEHRDIINGLDELKGQLSEEVISSIVKKERAYLDDYINTNPTFEIAFNVANKLNNNTTEEWELFLKIGKAGENFKDFYSTKLSGKERQAILVARKCHRIEKFDFDLDIACNGMFQVRNVAIPTILYNLYVVVNEGCELEFTKKLVTACNKAKYKIYIDDQAESLAVNNCYYDFEKIDQVINDDLRFSITDKINPKKIRTIDECYTDLNQVIKNMAALKNETLRYLYIVQGSKANCALYNEANDNGKLAKIFNNYSTNIEIYKAQKLEILSQIKSLDIDPNLGSNIIDKFISRTEKGILEFPAVDGDNSIEDLKLFEIYLEHKDVSLQTYTGRWMLDVIDKDGNNIANADFMIYATNNAENKKYYEDKVTGKLQVYDPNNAEGIDPSEVYPQYASDFKVLSVTQNFPGELSLVKRSKGENIFDVVLKGRNKSDKIELKPIVNEIPSGEFNVIRIK